MDKSEAEQSEIREFLAARATECVAAYPDSQALVVKVCETASAFQQFLEVSKFKFAPSLHGIFKADLLASKLSIVDARPSASKLSIVDAQVPASFVEELPQENDG